MKCQKPDVKELDKLDKCLGEYEDYGDRSACNSIAEKADTAIAKRFKFLGQGAFKKVYAINEKCVMKLPSPSIAITPITDMERWQDAPKELRKLMMPVLAQGKHGGWAIYPRAENVYDNYRRENVSDSIQVQHRREAHTLQKKLDKIGYRCNDLGEANIGYWAKSWRLLDFDLLNKCEIT